MTDATTLQAGAPAAAAPLYLDAYDVLGYQAAIGASTVEVRDAIRRIFQGFGPVDLGPGMNLPRYTITTTEAGRFVLDANGASQEDPDVSTSLSALEWYVVTNALVERTDLFQLHGAALCTPAARAGLIIVGDSNSGKSTLGLALTLRGFTSFSDDVALVDYKTLELQPMKRSFHLADDSRQMLSEFYGHPLRWPDEPAGYYFPPQWAEAPAPVRWVIFLEPQAAPRVPTLERLSPSDAARELLSRAPNLTQAARLTLSTAARLIEHASIYKLKSASLPELVDIVLDLVYGQAPTTP